MTLCKKNSSCSWREANTNQVAKLVPSQFSVTIPSNLPIGSVNYTYDAMTDPPTTNLAFNLGVSSLFINLILKTLHYFYMKVPNETISKWVHLSFYHKRFSRYLHLKFEKEVIF